MNCNFEEYKGSLRCVNCKRVFPRPRVMPLHVRCIASDEVVKKQAKKQVDGAGTELKKLLAKFGVTDKLGCGCKSHAQMMDSYGIEWSKNNVETIVTWLVDAAKNRGWAFAPRWGARRLVERAIRNAEKNAAKEQS